MEFINIFNNILYVLTTLGSIAIIIFLLGFLYVRFSSKKKTKKIRVLWDKISRNALGYAFGIALIATLGSLFYSEIAGFQPCPLCWYQRIFMYPLSIILGVAWYVKDKAIGRYTLTLSIIGFLIGLYHYLIQRTGGGICLGEGECTFIYVLGLEFISIPYMAMTAFLLIAIFSYVSLRKN